MLAPWGRSGHVPQHAVPEGLGTVGEELREGLEGVRGVAAHRQLGVEEAVPVPEPHLLEVEGALDAAGGVDVLPAALRALGHRHRDPRGRAALGVPAREALGFAGGRHRPRRPLRCVPEVLGVEPLDLRLVRARARRGGLLPAPRLRVAGADPDLDGPPLRGRAELPQLPHGLARHLLDAAHDHAAPPRPVPRRRPLHRVQAPVVQGEPGALAELLIAVLVPLGLAVRAADLGQPRDDADGREGRHQHEVVGRRP
mmetsp:Transcript_35684/g.96834  ORF Transcript_35684/g.96834 Transcript_35684/m.96834 type:complete len:255 (+) Transcript_35684:67-831(+)